MADLGAVDGEPPGAVPAVEGGEPQVVLGHEAHTVAVEVRKAQITHFPMFRPGMDRGNSYENSGSPRGPIHGEYETVSFRQRVRYIRRVTGTSQERGRCQA
ncbi:hypothetical protein GCM10010421_28850 [Streptomyces glaucus]|uniref:Uncharacterized protein n=1 Tax=Streptomyces glaucus TaxID=284029 RepID=A0ABN3JTZ7_9ACTN